MRDARRIDSVLPQFPLVMAEGKHPAMRRQLARTVNLQVVHHDVTLALEAKVNERIGHKHLLRHVAR